MRLLQVSFSEAGSSAAPKKSAHDPVHFHVQNQHLALQRKNCKEHAFRRKAHRTNELHEPFGGQRVRGNVVS